MATTATKKAWKLQEFVAHGSNVNCLALGHKSGRVMVTGGEDKKVNMWAVGKPNCIMSLSGHTSPVEAVRFGNAEEMVVAGSMSGALKIWDLEAAKIVRTLTGHKSNIRSLDFHPYGDFVASGSLDTNIKLWDIRRKGCIFTYKGHTNCVNNLRFSPDGRWIASAGEDGILKLWDLTAGKLLTDLKLHNGPVTTVEFHPNEFLLASGSADRTVKFWDLETFQLVCSTDNDATPVRCIFFHSEGLCLYSGMQDSLKVFGWEPARSYDSIPMGWGKVADISIAQNQLIGACFSQTNVSVYVVDIQRIPPLGNLSSELSTEMSPPMTASHVSPLVSGRRSFITERPPTQSTKQTQIVKTQKQAKETSSSPDEQGDDGDIKVHCNYREIFQPRHNLSADGPAHSPPRTVEPFPAPPADANAPAISASNASPMPPKRVVPVATPVIMPVPSEPVKVSYSSVSQPPVRVVREHHRPPSQNVISSERSRMGDIDVQEFLPKQITPSLLNQRHIPTDMSETEAVSLIVKGHDSMMAVMTNRNKNLQVVRALWTSGNMKTAVDSAIGMNDSAVIVDILNILLQKPNMWNLDLCASMLPQLTYLVTNKYENYVHTGCAALRLILKNFASVIKANITAPPSLGVDITREERYNKCKMCYKILMDIRSGFGQKQASQGKLASTFRELNILMSQLD